MSDLVYQDDRLDVVYVDGDPVVISDDTEPANTKAFSNLVAAKASLPPMEKITVTARASSGDGYGGDFYFVPGNQAANVAADPLNGVWFTRGGADGSSGAYRRKIDAYIMPEWFGAIGRARAVELGLNTTAQAALDTPAIQAAFEFGQLLNIPVLLTKSYRINETISPQYTFQINSQDADILAISSGTYTPVLDQLGADTGLKVVFDLINCKQSKISGQITIGASSYNDTLIALTASWMGATNGDGNESIYDNVVLSNCGYGLYQADQNNPAVDNCLPHARSKFGKITISSCGVGFRAAPNGTGFDETVFDSVLCRDWKERAFEINGTKFYANRVFLSPMPSTGLPAVTGAMTSGSNILTLSATAGFVVGDIAVVEDADGANRCLLADVTAVSPDGRTVTLNLNASATVAGKRIGRNPPDVGYISSGDFQVNELIYEGFFNKGLDIRRNAGCLIRNFKISTGLNSWRDGALIFSDWGEALIDIGMTFQISDNYRSIVRLARVREAGATYSYDYANRNVTIRLSCDENVYRDQGIEPVVMAGTTMNAMPSGHTIEVKTSDNIRIIDGKGTWQVIPRATVPRRLMWAMDATRRDSLMIAADGGVTAIELTRPYKGEITLINGVPTTIIPAIDWPASTTRVLVVTPVTSNLRGYIFCHKNAAGVTNIIISGGAGITATEAAGALQLTNTSGADASIRYTFTRFNDA